MSDRRKRIIMSIGHHQKCSPFWSYSSCRPYSWNIEGLDSEHKVCLECSIQEEHFNWWHKMSNIMFCINIKSPTNFTSKTETTRTAFCHGRRFYLWSMMFFMPPKQDELDGLNEPRQSSSNISNDICLFSNRIMHFSPDTMNLGRLQEGRRGTYCGRKWRGGNIQRNKTKKSRSFDRIWG